MPWEFPPARTAAPFAGPVQPPAFPASVSYVIVKIVWSRHRAHRKQIVAACAVLGRDGDDFGRKNSRILHLLCTQRGTLVQQSIFIDDSNRWAALCSALIIVNSESVSPRPAQTASWSGVLQFWQRLAAAFSYAAGGIGRWQINLFARAANAGEAAGGCLAAWGHNS